MKHACAAQKAVLVLLLTIVTLLAQSDLTSISGYVKDPSNAVVPHAVVTLVNEATRQERTTEANEVGRYTFTNIPAAMYTLMVAAPGFKKTTVTGNKLDPSIPANVDVTLTVGQTSDSVLVEAQAAAIQADTATLGRVVAESQIENLQLNGRNPLFLAVLKPGVGGGVLAGFNFGLSNGNLNINGSRPQENLIAYDGAVAIRTRNASVTIGVADVDATQEVQILTANYNAEYGRSSGGQVRIVTKSGQRDFHGTAYEFLRNSALDANTWIRNHTTGQSSAPVPFRYNQFGYNISGPVYIPKLFNTGRTRLFFLFGQEILRYRKADTVQRTVPSLLMRNGDFSELLDKSSPLYTGKTITDPLSGTPFAGNAIPTSRLSANGIALLNVYPSPTAGFQSGTNNYYAMAPAPENQRKETYSFDVLPIPMHTIRFRAQNYNYNSVSPFADNVGRIPQLWDRPNTTASVNHVWTISPVMVNELLITASVDRVRIGIDKGPGTYDRTRYGITYPYLFPEGKLIPNKIPTISISNLQEINGLPYPSSSAGPVYNIADNFTKVWGSHTFKFGALWERAGENDFDQINVSGVPGGTNNQNGRFVFNDSRPGGTGVAAANAALGLFTTYAEIGERSYTPYRGHMWEFFLQDSWKVTRKLHLDIGIRESIIQPYYSLWGNMVVFDPAYYDPAKAVKVDPKTGNPIPGSGDPLNGAIVPGGLTSAGKGRVPALDSGKYDRLYKPNEAKYYSDIHVLQGFQPRIGIAYQLNEKTVVRTGGGRFLTRLGVSDSVLLGGNPPLQPTASISNGSVDNPSGTTTGVASYPLGINGQDKIFYNPEAWSWNATVQRELLWRTTVEVAYVGRRGLHTQQERNINQLLPGTVQANPGVNENALRPYLGYSAIRVTNNTGTSLYNGLQIDVNRRLASGLMFGFAYTYSKSMDNGSAPKDSLGNAYDRSTYWGPSDYDRRHVAVFNAVYPVPFLRGKSGWSAKLLGAWQLSATAQFQTGTPFSVQSDDDFAGVGSGSGNGTGMKQRWIIDGAIAQPGAFADSSAPANYYYAFVSQTGPLAATQAVNVRKPTTGTFSPQRSRNMFYNPGFQNWNAGLFKDFALTERHRFTFRAEAFNFLNHPNWSGVDSNPNSKYFGQVTNKDANQPNRNIQLSLRYSF